MKRFYGWTLSTKPLNRVHSFKAVRIPAIIDLSAYKMEVIDQGNIGRCSGCGIDGIISGRLSQLGINPGNKTMISPDGLYALGRKKEGTLNQDAGAEPYDILTMGQTYGVIPYSLLPLQPKLFTGDPTTPEWEAKAVKYPKFIPVGIDVSDPNTALANILDAMAGGNFINFGFYWFSAWEDYTGGLLPMQTPSDPIAGGHDTFGFYADSVNRKFKIQNSWGKLWGEDGCYELPYDMIPILAGMGMEANYVSFDAPNPVPPPPPVPSQCCPLLTLKHQVKANKK